MTIRGLSCALKQLRLMGVRLSIDDTGAGFASLAHILKLAPDIIKLDRELIAASTTTLCAVLLLPPS